jgi:hypothetical protein
LQKFYWRSNTLFSVEDVMVRDGKLQTESGTELKAVGEFKSLIEETAPPPMAGERLMRRGK